MIKAATVSTKNDEQLLQEYLNGDNNALGILYSRYYQKVYYKCLSFTKNPDDAFDYAQEILIKSFSKAHSFKGESKFSTWLFSITHNYCITHVGKSNKFHFEDIDVQFGFMDDGFEVQEFEDRKQREENELNLNNYMDELSDFDKDILKLKYRQNYSIKDLQDKFNLSASAVKMRLMRARQRVEQIYEIHSIT